MPFNKRKPTWNENKLGNSHYLAYLQQLTLLMKPCLLWRLYFGVVVLKDYLPKSQENQVLLVTDFNH